MASFSADNNPSPYELFLYFEQGHRLAFGSGVVPFDYIYGYRSWLVPAFIAGVMRLCGAFSSDPRLYLFVLRELAVALSLSAILAAYLIARRAAGTVWALVAALFIALWYQTVYYASSLDPGVLAAYTLLFAVWLAQEDKNESSATFSAAIGALLGLTFYLRFHLSPALLLVAIWHLRRACTVRLPPLLLGIAAVLVPFGLLDAVTWGTPFQSIWLNFHMNIDEGVARQFGEDPPWFYLEHLIASPRWWFVSILFGALALLGARRAPLLGLSMAIVLVSHSAIAHKEDRFIVFTLISIPILMGLGLATISEWLERQAGTVAPWASAGIAAVILIASGYGIRSEMRDGLNAGVLQAFLTAHDDRKLCGLAVAGYDWYFTGGYTFLHRDAPIYFPFELTHEQKPGYYGSKYLRGLSLATKFVLNGRSLGQFDDAELLARTYAYNDVITRVGRSIPGYRLVRCFPDPASPGPEACLLHREGHCSAIQAAAGL